MTKDYRKKAEELSLKLFKANVPEVVDAFAALAVRAHQEGLERAAEITEASNSWPTAGKYFAVYIRAEIESGNKEQE